MSLCVWHCGSCLNEARSVFSTSLSACLSRCESLKPLFGCFVEGQETRMILLRTLAPHPLGSASSDLTSLQYHRTCFIYPALLLQGDQSPWAAFLQTLPHSTQSPILWTEAECQTLLRGTSIQQEAATRAASLKQEWASLQSIQRAHKGKYPEGITEFSSRTPREAWLSALCRLPLSAVTDILCSCAHRQAYESVQRSSTKPASWQRCLLSWRMLHICRQQTALRFCHWQHYWIAAEMRRQPSWILICSHRLQSSPPKSLTGEATT